MTLYENFGRGLYVTLYVGPRIGWVTVVMVGALTTLLERLQRIVQRLLLDPCIRGAVLPPKK